MSQNYPRPRLTENNPDWKAEGDIILKDGSRVAYDTELASSAGVTVHYWIGEREPTDELFNEIVRIARNTRDVVGNGSYCIGEPAAYWAREEMREGR